MVKAPTDRAGKNTWKIRSPDAKRLEIKKFFFLKKGYLRTCQMNNFRNIL
jgi:hypothetical protein